MRWNQIMSAHKVIKSKKWLRTVSEVLHLQQIMGQLFLHFQVLWPEFCLLLSAQAAALREDELSCRWNNYCPLVIQSFQHKSLWILLQTLEVNTT